WSTRYCWSWASNYSDQSAKATPACSSARFPLPCFNRSMDRLVGEHQPITNSIIVTLIPVVREQALLWPCLVDPELVELFTGFGQTFAHCSSQYTQAWVADAVEVQRFHTVV